MRLLFRFLRKFNDDNPTRSEVSYCLDIITEKDIDINIQIFSACSKFSQGHTLEAIGVTFNVTRERIRQYTHKLCRVAYNGQ